MQVDDASANDIMAQLLVLESLDPDRDITMYINSPGGSFTSLMAIYDTMQYVRADIQTVCLGQAASAAAVLLAAGTPGKRMALPERAGADPPARTVRRRSRASSPTWRSRPRRSSGCARLMETTLAHHTGKDAAQIRKDTDRDKILTAEEAKDYGDHRHRPGVPASFRRRTPSSPSSQRTSPAHGGDVVRPHAWQHRPMTRCRPAAADAESASSADHARLSPRSMRRAIRRPDRFAADCG